MRHRGLRLILAMALAVALAGGVAAFGQQAGFGARAAKAAVMNPGQAWVWGYTPGAGQWELSWEPVPVSGFSDVVDIAGAESVGSDGVVGGHYLFLRSNGTVWAWGKNRDGQLGDGTNIDRDTPVQVPGLSDVVDVEARLGGSLALKNDGTVWAWGLNQWGQLGDGTTVDRNTPVKALGLSDVTDIEDGEYLSLAVKNDGTVWTWGRGGNGQLGPSKEIVEPRNDPSYVVCATDGDDDGRNDLYYDDPYYNDSAHTPRQVCDPALSTLNHVVPFSDVNRAVGGSARVTLLKNDGTVWRFGEGNDTAPYPEIPTRVSSLSGVTDVAAGDHHDLALKNDGTVWAWGRNLFGEIGDGTNRDRKDPVLVSGVSGITAVEAGNGSSLALKNDGTVWAWGSTGIWGVHDSNTPVRVDGLSDVSGISAGGDTYAAIMPPDTTPPNTTITSGPSGVTKSTSASFRFSSSEAGSRFQCSLDGSAFASCSSPKGYADLKNGRHTFRVRAIDQAGNVDASPASRTWTVDTIKPTISGMSPKHESVIRDTTPTIKATVKDNLTNLQKANIKLYVNGTLISPTKYSYSASTDVLLYNSPRLTLGKKTVKIVATDAAGNVGTKSWYFTIK